ncbi:MAG: hypothetical protein ACHP7K_09580 [Actinomycetales bacterium]
MAGSAVPPSAAITTALNADAPNADGVRPLAPGAAPREAGHAGSRHAREPAPGLPRCVAVVPVVDVNLGTVDLRADGTAFRFWTAEPDRLVRALSGAVRPVRWYPDSAELAVPVAAAGHRQGLVLVFGLSR